MTATLILILIHALVWFAFTPAYYLALGMLALLLILMVTDRVGWADVAYLILAAIPFVLLIKDRSWCLKKEGWKSGDII